jgi:predicted nicotinamide N-methyase
VRPGAAPGRAAAPGPARQGKNGPMVTAHRPDPDALAFVRAHTRLAALPFVPEVSLHLADDAIALWEHTERAAGTRLAPPFWAFAWAGGQALARYLLDHPDLVAGRTVLDLAAGGGVVSVAAAKAGAARVTAAEIDPAALAALALNASANGVTVTAVLGDILDAEPPDADLITAGDVCYNRDMTARVLAFLSRAAARATDVLVGDPGRAYVPRDRLDALATYRVPTTYALESAEVKVTTVWQLPPGAGADGSASSSRSPARRG